MSNRTELASIIVATLLEDIVDRDGVDPTDIGDDEGRAEIRDAWVDIVADIMADHGVE